MGLLYLFIIRALYIYVSKDVRIRGCVFTAKRVPRAKNFWKLNVTFLRCVLIAAVRVVQSTRPPYCMRVTVRESMCSFAGGFMLVSINESCRHRRMTGRQGCTYPSRHCAVATELLRTVSPNVCRSSVWSLLPVYLLTSRILSLLLWFWKMCAPPPPTREGTLYVKSCLRLCLHLST